MTNYFRRFIKDYSKIACWLTRLTKDDVVFAWTEKQQESFDKLKEALTSPPVLAMPDFSKPFTVECDASEYALGGILTQDGRPIAYESRVLTSAEQNYETHDRECLAVVHCYQAWRCYLEGVESTCVTDHHPLTYLQTQPRINRRQARWMEFLASFRPHIVYRPGTRNPADPLSRLCAVAHSLRAAGGSSRVRGRSQKVCALTAPQRGEGTAARGEGFLPMSRDLISTLHSVSHELNPSVWVRHTREPGCT